MMLDEKIKFVEALRQVPIISYSCKVTGIPRSTYYRWYHDDKLFAKKVNIALTQGRDTICDLAESVLIKKLKEDSFPAAAFVLRTFNGRPEEKNADVEVRHTVEEKPPEPPQQKRPTRSEIKRDRQLKIFVRGVVETALEKRREEQRLQSERWKNGQH